MYNIVVWGSVSLELREDIERIHMRALKIVYKLPMTTPTDEIKKLRQWNPISSYYVKMPVVVTCRSYHGSNTEELNILISKAKPNYSLRNSLNIEVPGPRSEIGRSSFKHWETSSASCQGLCKFEIIKIGLSANKHVQVGKSKVSLYMGPSGPWGRCLTPVFLA